MPTFNSTVQVGYDIEVEAEDMYEAEEKIRNMPADELMEIINKLRPVFIDRDNYGEFPQEV